VILPDVITDTVAKGNASFEDLDLVWSVLQMADPGIETTWIADSPLYAGWIKRNRSVIDAWQVHRARRHEK
jgi:hypothetical protein